MPNVAHSCQERRGRHRAIQFSNAIPMRASACIGWAANRRQAAAMLVWPAHLKSPIAVLRSVAITWPKTNTDSAGELLRRGCQRRKGCDIRFRSVWFCEPGYDPYHIDRHCNQDMLQMGFRQANVARPPSVKRAHALGEGAFNARPQRVLLFAHLIMVNPRLCRAVPFNVTY
jgi:hypothetical protein